MVLGYGFGLPGVPKGKRRKVREPRSPARFWSEARGLSKVRLNQQKSRFKTAARYIVGPTCCPLVRFSHIGSIEDAPRNTY